MFREGLLLAIMRTVRGIGIFAVFLIALTGSPGTASAFECHDYVIVCESVASCMAEHGKDCYQPGPCTGKIYCEPSENYSDCYYSGEDVARLCRDVTPE